MTPRAAIIRIPEPCAESWATMTPTSGGGHCAACQKTVVDFTQKTDAEILTYFRQVGAERTCGRFRAGQLGRPLQPARPAPRPLRWQLWLAGLLAAALSTQSCQSTTGEAQPTTTRLLPPPPTLGVPAIDSATAGDIKTTPLLGDTVLVSPAPKVPAAPVDTLTLLGETAIQ